MSLTRKICWVAVAASAFFCVVGCSDWNQTSDSRMNNLGSTSLQKNDANGEISPETGNTANNRNANQAFTPGSQTGTGTAGGM